MFKSKTTIKWLMKSVPKTVIVIFIFFIMGVSLISYASAITGSIGNARMIISKDSEGDKISVGDEIKKYVLVRNPNDVSVNIDIFASGDLEDYIDVEDDKFTLVAGEEKKAYFVVKVGIGGTTESRINVQFDPEEGSGVGLSSTVIVVAQEPEGFLGQLFGGDDDEDSDDEDADRGFSLSTGNAIGGNGDDEEDNGMDGRIILVIVSTSIIVVIFIVVLVLYYLKMKKEDNPEKDAKTKKDGEKEAKKKDKKSVKTKPKKSVTKNE